MAPAVVGFHNWSFLRGGGTECCSSVASSQSLPAATSFRGRRSSGEGACRMVSSSWDKSGLPRRWTRADECACGSPELTIPYRDQTRSIANRAASAPCCTKA